MTTTDRPIDLQSFCDDDERRGYGIGKPFSRGEYTWATDGKIMLRVPRRDDVPENDKAPRAECVWPKVAADAFQPLVNADLPDPGRETCEVCEGRGTEHTCPDCSCKCKFCDGAGTMEEEIAVELGDFGEILVHYAKLLLSLPGIAVAEPADGIMQFRFDGGEGIMTILKPTHTLLPIVGRIEVAAA